MGLTKGDGGNVTYLKLTKGAFFKTKDKDGLEPFKELTGIVTDLYFRNEQFDGQTTKKLYTVVSDGEDKFAFGISAESKLATRLLDFLKSADLSRDLTIRAGVEKDETADKKAPVRTAIFVIQDGANIKAAFTKASPNGRPDMKEVKIGSKKVWDREEYNKFYENLVLNDLQPKVKSNKPEPKGAPHPAAQNLQDNSEDIDDNDDLPF